MDRDNWPQIKNQGFTLTQVLIVLAIFAILTGVAVGLLRPSGILEKTRDAQRFSDINTLATVINLYLADGYNFDNLEGTYSSIDLGFSSSEDRQNIDGTGWIPLDFTNISTALPFSVLPLDPLNNVQHHYRFAASVDNKTYELNCHFESIENISKAATDNGSSDDIFEIGTDLNII